MTSALLLLAREMKNQSFVAYLSLNLQAFNELFVFVVLCMHRISFGALPVSTFLLITNVYGN